MKNHKKIIILLILLFLFISIFLIVQIYAKYVSSANGNASIAISRWAITVNNQSIKTASNISSSIIPVFPGNENMASNIIAPGAEGYFDLNLDFTNVDVSFKYTISMLADTESAVSDIVATGYSIDGATPVTFSTFNEDISETIPYNSSTKTQNIRIFIKWNDDLSTSYMNNIEDTHSTTLSHNKALFNVNILFEQVVN